MVIQEGRCELPKTGRTVRGGMKQPRIFDDGDNGICTWPERWEDGIA